MIQYNGGGSNTLITHEECSQRARPSYAENHEKNLALLKNDHMELAASDGYDQNIM